jgi:hypothetical protein
MPLRTPLRAALVAALALAACQEKPASEAAATGAPQRGQSQVVAERARPGGGSADTGGDRASVEARTGGEAIQQIEGQVARASGDALEIRSPDEPSMTLRIVPETRVTMNGQPIGIELIQPGSDVLAAYDRQGGKPTAITIQARPKRRSETETGERDIGKARMHRGSDMEAGPMGGGVERPGGGAQGAQGGNDAGSSGSGSGTGPSNSPGLIR